MRKIVDGLSNSGDLDGPSVDHSACGTHSIALAKFVSLPSCSRL